MSKTNKSTKDLETNPLDELEEEPEPEPATRRKLGEALSMPDPDEGLEPDPELDESDNLSKRWEALNADIEALDYQLSRNMVVSKADSRDHLLRVLDLIRRFVDLVHAGGVN